KEGRSSEFSLVATVFMMASVRSLLSLSATLFLGLGLIGCPNPDGSFDDFAERADAVPKSDAGPGACGDVPVDKAEGDFFLALAAVQVTKPVTFFAKLTTDAAGLHMNVQPFAYVDRTTLVGTPMDLGPFPIDAQGNFVADLTEITVVGEANPI